MQRVNADGVPEQAVQRGHLKELCFRKKKKSNVGVVRWIEGRVQGRKEWRRRGEGEGGKGGGREIRERGRERERGKGIRLH